MSGERPRSPSSASRDVLRWDSSSVSAAMAPSVHLYQTAYADEADEALAAGMDALEGAAAREDSSAAGAPWLDRRVSTANRTPPGPGDASPAAGAASDAAAAAAAAAPSPAAARQRHSQSASVVSRAGFDSMVDGVLVEHDPLDDEEERTLLGEMPALAPEQLRYREHSLSRLDWNEQFVRALQMPEGEDRDEELVRLHQDFLGIVEQYGRAIIQELFLRDEDRTLHKKRIGGFSGGDKFVARGIVFKLARDPRLRDGTYMYGGGRMNMESAAKAAGHEIKGAAAYFGANAVGVFTPMMAVLDVHGFRLLGMAQLPLDKLIYGSKDGGATVRASNRLFNARMRSMARELHLATHYVGQGAARTTLYSAGDVEGWRGIDGRFYLLDLARTFPPEYAPECGHLPRAPLQSIFFRLLRPELLQHLRATRRLPPLSPDALSSWGRSDPDELSVRHNDMVRVATRVLVNEVIPALVRDLLGFDELSVMVGGGGGGGAAAAAAEASPAPADDPAAHPVVDLREEFHRRGIGMRHLGLVYTLVERQKADAARTEGAAFHERADRVLRNLLTQMVARTLKNLLRQALRQAHIKDARQPSRFSAQQRAAGFLNLCSGCDRRRSAQFWESDVWPGLEQRFGLGPLPRRHEVMGRVRAERALEIVSYVCAATGVRLTASCEHQFAGAPHRFEFAAVDVHEQAGMRIKTMQVVELARGRFLERQAERLARDGARAPAARVFSASAFAFRSAVADRTLLDEARAGLARVEARLDALLRGAPGARRGPGRRTARSARSMGSVFGSITSSVMDEPDLARSGGWYRRPTAGTAADASISEEPSSALPSESAGPASQPSQTSLAAAEAAGREAEHAAKVAAVSPPPTDPLAAVRGLDTGSPLFLRRGETWKGWLARAAARAATRGDRKGAARLRRAARMPREKRTDAAISAALAEDRERVLDAVGVVALVGSSSSAAAASAGAAAAAPRGGRGGDDADDDGGGGTKRVSSFSSAVTPTAFFSAPTQSASHGSLAGAAEKEAGDDDDGGGGGGPSASPPAMYDVLALSADPSATEQLARQLGVLYNVDLESEERRAAFVPAIRRAAVGAMLALLYEFDNLNVMGKLRGRGQLERELQLPREAQEAREELERAWMAGDGLDERLAASVELLWREPLVNATYVQYSGRGRLVATEAMAHFLESARHFASPSFVPTVEDTVRLAGIEQAAGGGVATGLDAARPGMRANRVTWSGHVLRVHDASGQLRAGAHTSKFLSHFAQCQAWIYVAGLAGYDEPAAAAADLPRRAVGAGCATALLRDMALFRELCRGARRYSRHVVLFLNQRDQFAQRLRDVPLTPLHLDEAAVGGGGGGGGGDDDDVKRDDGEAVVAVRALGEAVDMVRRAFERAAEAEGVSKVHVLLTESTDPALLGAAFDSVMALIAGVRKQQAGRL